MVKLSFAAAAALAAMVLPAHADQHAYLITGDDGFGSYTANVTLNIDNGFATSGGGTISGANIDGTQNVYLITANSPGATPYGSDPTMFQFNTNDGTDQNGIDDKIPLDSSGIDFTIGAPPAGDMKNAAFNVADYGGGNVSSFFSGTVSPGDQNFYGGGATTFEDLGAVSSAPEPGTWALMMLGVGAIGAMLGYRKRVVVDHKAKLAAIG